MKTIATAIVAALALSALSSAPAEARSGLLCEMFPSVCAPDGERP